MKKLIFSILVLGFSLSLCGQETISRHSLSLNFSGGFPQRFNGIMPQELFRRWLPGLEYRFLLNEKVQLRAGLKYNLPQTWVIGNPSIGFFSRNLVESSAIQVGAQLHFWSTSYLQNFQSYVFSDFGFGSSTDEIYILNPANIPQEINSESINRHIGVKLGIGLSYWFGEKWVVRFESAYQFRRHALELTSGSAQFMLQTAAIFEGDTSRFFGYGLIPISEVSIGWRF